MFSVREDYCWPIETAAANRTHLGEWIATKWNVSIPVCSTGTVVFITVSLYIWYYVYWLLFAISLLCKGKSEAQVQLFKHADVYLCLTGPYFRRSVHATLLHFKKLWRVIILLIHSNTWKLSFVEISLGIAYEREPKAMNWQLRLDCR